MISASYEILKVNNFSPFPSFYHFTDSGNVSNPQRVCNARFLGLHYNDIFYKIALIRQTKIILGISVRPSPLPNIGLVAVLREYNVLRSTVWLSYIWLSCSFS